MGELDSIGLAYRCPSGAGCLSTPDVASWFSAIPQSIRIDAIEMRRRTPQRGRPHRIRAQRGRPRFRPTEPSRVAVVPVWSDSALAEVGCAAASLGELVEFEASGSEPGRVGPRHGGFCGSENYVARHPDTVLDVACYALRLAHCRSSARSHCMWRVLCMCGCVL